MRTKITVLVLATLILISAGISYVTLFPPAPSKTGVAGIAATARAEGESGEDFLVGLGRQGRLPGIGLIPLLLPDQFLRRHHRVQFFRMPDDRHQ